MPLAAQLEPDLILVSAGYDCAKGDQLGRFAVTGDAFGLLSRMLLAVAPTVFILEGGYDVEESMDRPHGPIRDGVAATIESLLDVAAIDGEDEVLPTVTLPEGWREDVRNETKQLVRDVLERLGTLS